MIEQRMGRREFLARTLAAAAFPIVAPASVLGGWDFSGRILRCASCRLLRSRTGQHRTRDRKGAHTLWGG